MRVSLSRYVGLFCIILYAMGHRLEKKACAQKEEEWLELELLREDIECMKP
ncbi:hypothetical protein [Bartonella machadoae]|uniref:hypothetical protein n=1 Tax=Bartonella machadoae TaxID=2893471 RepID=UPI001F4D0A0B|nr:hypothetical protein [Bartonella machadoae]UNE54037.1 hypothetical protein LNM86_10855 [Bartonella machadoae]